MCFDIDIEGLRHISKTITYLMVGYYVTLHLNSETHSHTVVHFTHRRPRLAVTTAWCSRRAARHRTSTLKTTMMTRRMTSQLLIMVNCLLILLCDIRIAYAVLFKFMIFASDWTLYSTMVFVYIVPCIIRSVLKKKNVFLQAVKRAGVLWTARTAGGRRKRRTRRPLYRLPGRTAISLGTHALACLC